MRRWTMLCAVIAALAVVAGCGSDHSREDADDVRTVCPRDVTARDADGCVDKTQPKVLAFNNQFVNVQAKCDHTNRIYVVTKGEFRFSVVENDPACGGTR